MNIPAGIYLIGGIITFVYMLKFARTPGEPSFFTVAFWPAYLVFALVYGTYLRLAERRRRNAPQ